MSEQPTVPLFDESTIRQALERLRQAVPLRDNPLRRLIWVQAHVEKRSPVVSAAGLDVALGMALSDLIEENLSHLRTLEGLPDEPTPDRESALAALKNDFLQGNTELEAWSSLYHRYVRLDLNLQVHGLSGIVEMEPRQLRRRMNHGYRRLTEAISRLEIGARAANWHSWLRSKLPPPHYAKLFGLERAVARLGDLLCAPRPPHVVALVGPGGIGKTTLAHAVTSQLLEDDRFQDFVWITFEEPTGYPTLLALLARDLGYWHLAEAGLADLESGLIVHLSSTPTLIVLDNVDYLDNHANLLTRLGGLVTVGCLILTLRQYPSSDAPIHVFPVEPLSRDDLAALLRQYARMRRISQTRHLNDEAIDTIYQVVGGNPLAGRLIISQLAFLPLDRVLENLSALKTSQGVELFDWLFVPTWQMVSDTARQVALALLLLPPQCAYWHDLLAVSGLSPDELDDALRELISSSLVDTKGDEPRYEMHALARRFVEEQARQRPWAERYRHLLQVAVERETQVEESAEADDAARMMTLIHRQAEASEKPGVLGTLVVKTAPVARRSGQWLVWRDVLHFTVANLRASGGHVGELARSLLELGVAYRWLGEPDRAAESLEETIRLFGEHGNFIDQAEALLEIGRLHESMGQTDPAYASYQRAAATAYRYDATHLRRRALNGLAGLALHNDLAEEALDLLTQALETFGDEPPDGQTLSLLGMAHLRKGDTGEAVACQRQALQWFQEVGDLPKRARAHLRLGMAYHAAGRLDEALQQHREGLGLMNALGDALGQARLLTNLGAVYSALERWEAALETWREAIALQRQLGDQVGMAYAWYNLADLQWKIERYTEAHAALGEAQGLAERLDLLSLLAHIKEHPAWQRPLEME